MKWVNSALTAIGMADGGYVPATEGGQLHILGEGGGGEYVIPESKMRSMGSNNFYIYGYTDSELTAKIREVTRSDVVSSAYRSGF